jgi:tRNA-dihydrouridine synthase B
MEIVSLFLAKLFYDFRKILSMKIGKINIDKPLLLAPMEDVTDPSFRLVCKKLGADIVYTEFVNSEGLIRNSEKTRKKLKLLDEERPAGIQIYGANIDSMVEAAKIAEEENPEIIDINCGCWVKNVVGHGAGAGLLKDIPYMGKMISAVVKAVTIPVTVKTRLGWDFESIKILEVAKMIEAVGAQAVTIHCRTKSQGHKGVPDWSWIPRVKEVVQIPVMLNGGVLRPEDAKRAFEETHCDAVMIARGAIGNPWIFLQTKQLLWFGHYDSKDSLDERMNVMLDHLKHSCELKGERRGVIEFRKYYSGYLKGFYNSAKLRSELMVFFTIDEIVNHLEVFKLHYHQHHDLFEQN